MMQNFNNSLYYYEIQHGEWDNSEAEEVCFSAAIIHNTLLAGITCITETKKNIRRQKIYKTKNSFHFLLSIIAPPPSTMVDID
ncbi:hypothetical protein SK128_021553 [Halocaridina rubra]|uniref:Uncharacterized protein n=1 Tax=Halocaridina rubra TaxID=373956 RepID=A0AAN8ZVP9_HALRR